MSIATLLNKLIENKYSNLVLKVEEVYKVEENAETVESVVE